MGIYGVGGAGAMVGAIACALAFRGVALTWHATWHADVMRCLALAWCGVL